MSADCNQKSAILDSSASVCRKFAIIYWFLLSSRLCNLQREKIGVFVVSFLEGRGPFLSSLQFGMSEWKDEKVQSHSHHIPPCLGDSRDCPGPLSAWRRESDQLLAGPRTHALGRAHRWRRTSTSTRYSHYSAPNLFYIFSWLNVRRIFAWKAWSRSNYLNNL